MNCNFLKKALHISEINNGLEIYTEKEG